MLHLYRTHCDTRRTLARGLQHDVSVFAIHCVSIDHRSASCYVLDVINRMTISICFVKDSHAAPAEQGELHARPRAAAGARLARRRLLRGARQQDHTRRRCAEP